MSDIVRQRVAAAWNNPLLTQLRKFYANRGLVLTSAYGRRKNPITGVLEFHNGIDLAPRTHEARHLELYDYDEIMLLPYPDAAGGLSVLVRYKNMRLGMAHLESFVNVRQRHWVARIGTTGKSTGVHLHLTFSYTTSDKPSLSDASSWLLEDPITLF